MALDYVESIDGPMRSLSSTSRFGIWISFPNFLIYD